MVFDALLGTPKKLPKHLAITTEGSIAWANSEGRPVHEAFQKKFANIEAVIPLAVRFNIPVLTFHLFRGEVKEHFEDMLDAMTHFFDRLKESGLVHDNQIKVSVLGKWYDLPGAAVGNIKDLLQATGGYDRFFLNFCVNYSGQQEIVDACRLIARRIEAGKMRVEEISKETIKENLYTSYFLPPQVIIRSGTRMRLSDFLIWDSPGAFVHFSGKHWPAMGKKDILDALDVYSKS